MGRRKKVNEEPIVEQINEQVIEEDTAKQAESEIEFLIKKNPWTQTVLLDNSFDILA